MKVLNLLKVLRLFVHRYLTKAVGFVSNDGVCHSISSYFIDSITGILYLSECNPSDFYRSLEFEEVKL